MSAWLICANSLFLGHLSQWAAPEFRPPSRNVRTTLDTAPCDPSNAMAS